MRRARRFAEKYAEGIFDLMVTYPVRVPRAHYGGANPRKARKVAEQNRIAGELEKYINEKIKSKIEKGETERYTQLMYGYIAYDTGYDEETVRNLFRYRLRP
jgi:hypothetical protein